mmetsp:Transcript_18120/g.31565  ORF Transcript_18120/g.31565 Transcript_18120/m.31565 type:complete len:200 (-) Transcript_18120:906-1505(-)
MSPCLQSPCCCLWCAVCCCCGTFSASDECAVSPVCCSSVWLGIPVLQAPCPVFTRPGCLPLDVQNWLQTIDSWSCLIILQILRRWATETHRHFAAQVRRCQLVVSSPIIHADTFVVLARSHVSVFILCTPVCSHLWCPVGSVSSLWRPMSVSGATAPSVQCHRVASSSWHSIRGRVHLFPQWSDIGDKRGGGAVCCDCV